MPLRSRLILSYAVLILLLGLAAWAGVRTLTADLTDALGESAASVGRSVFTVLRHERRVSRDEAPEGADGQRREVQRDVLVLRPEAAARDVEADVSVVVNGRALSPEELAAHAAVHARHPEFEVKPELHGGRPRLLLRGEGFAQAIDLPRAGVDAALDRFTRQLGWGLAALLALGLLLSAWLAQRIARPLRALADAAQAVGRGTLGAQAPDGGVPEVRQTIAAFNAMSTRLQQLDAEAAALRADRELAELGEIGRGLAHSLRNPLHALGLSLEALAAQAAEPPRAQELAQAGREQLQRVDQALRGFLALSAGAGAASEAVVLREVVDDVLLEASQRAQGRVVLQREGGGDARLRAVPAELRVMLHTLVVNALEASPDGGRVTLRVLAPATPEAPLVIEVEDEGEGVPEAIRARLFQPHVSGKPHGAGMGLYLAERLARLRYGGGIELLPRAPRGTLARLTLREREAAHG